MRAPSSALAAGCSGIGRAVAPQVKAKSDVWIMAQLHRRLKVLYKKEGGSLR